MVKTLVKTYNKKIKNIVIAKTENKSKQKPEQPQTIRLYNKYRIVSIIKLIKKITKTQVIMVPAIATKTLGGLNRSVFHG